MYAGRIRSAAPLARIIHSSLALTPGTRLGVYEITAQIGEGGMGQVYRATDTKLKRQVAIKILPPAVAADADRLARFQREAEVLASLNHPNIAGIYGLEESGGMTALVMELVEGDDLSQRIARGAIPVDEALPIAKQIAEALEAAHEQGIIHRDLKPANIKVRSDGTVKVLDFGLAKAMEPAAGLSPSLSMSPTITTPAMMTGVGMILGTAAYMSPEQARGKAVDKRADIWAFGAVLFEMLTGQRAFGGDDVSEVLSRVLQREPAWETLPAALPPTLLVYLKRCLHKDLKQRIGDIHDVRLALEGAFETGVSQVAAAVSMPQAPVWRRALPLALTSLLTAVVIGAAAWFATRTPPAAVVRTEVTTSGASAMSLSGADRDVAITPDGSRIVYRGQNQLLVRALNQLTPTALTGLGAPRGPFISPDGQWVGFFDGTNALKKVAITGGPAVSIGMVDGQGARGATWGEDGTIIFATTAPGTGLQRVSAAGGEPAVLTKAGAGAGDDHFWPEFLPGGQAVLFTVLTTAANALDNAQIAVLDLRTNTQTVLVRGGSHAHYLPSGHLVYGAGGTLRAVAFDLGTLSVVGTPVPVLEQVTMTGNGGVDAVVADNGTLVYVAGGVSGATGPQRSLVWVDRTGREEPLPAPPRAYGTPRVSPDGTRVAMRLGDEELDLWVYDLARATLTRLTFEPTNDSTPIWTPDGRRLVFASSRTGQQNLYIQPADGTGSAVRLTDSPNLQATTGISPDGTRVLFNENTGAMKRDIGVLTLPQLLPRGGGPAGSSLAKVEPLLSTRFEERGGIVSPDGRWMAYESDSSGRFEIYVRPFPAVGEGQWQVSTGGGVQALWSRDDRELFYLAPDGSLMSVPVDARGAAWSAGTPSRLITKSYFASDSVVAPGRMYDVSPDGRRFLMIKEGRSTENDPAVTPPNLIVVQHWLEELKRLVPTN